MSSWRNGLLLAVSVLALMAAGLAAYGCGDSEEEAAPTQAPSTPQSEGASVDIEDFAFKPETVTISVGDMVTWTNQDSATHTVVGDDFHSGDLAKGETFSTVFESEGTFDYHCSLHPSMKGRVIVEE